jgi:threonine dehydrogenase-like Zn-dependent dehydrogenase
MRATLMYRAGDVHIEKVPDARLIEPTDALVVITAACICGSDLWPYKELGAVESGRPMGHEAIGRRCGPTSPSCYPTSWKARSTRAASSIVW